MCSINYSSRSKCEIVEIPNKTKEEPFLLNKPIVSKASSNIEDF